MSRSEKGVGTDREICGSVVRTLNNHPITSPPPTPPSTLGSDAIVLSWIIMTASTQVDGKDSSEYHLRTHLDAHSAQQAVGSDTGMHLTGWRSWPSKSVSLRKMHPWTPLPPRRKTKSPANLSCTRDMLQTRDSDPDEASCHQLGWGTDAIHLRQEGGGPTLLSPVKLSLRNSKKEKNNKTLLGKKSRVGTLTG